MSNQLKFFMAALAHSEIDDFEKYLIKYIDVSGRYLIAMEIATDSHAQTKGHHFHVAADMDDKSWDAFRKTILVKKYNLKGQARGGNARQYGLVHNVRDEFRMLSYTVKDGAFRTNMELELLQEYIEASFPKKKCIDHIKAMMQSIVSANHHKLNDFNQLEVDIQKVEFEILQYYIDHELMKSINKNQLKSLTIRYLMYFEKKVLKDILLKQLYYYINF